MKHKALEEYLLSKPGGWLDYPFGEGVAVYKVGEASLGKMFALISEKSDPLRLSLKCEPLLAEQMRQDFETVLPGYHLNKKHWNTIICSGQLSEEQIHSLIDLSYGLVVKSLSKSEQERLAGAV